MPALIGATARVASTCPVTRQAISLTVAPGGVETLSPDDAVVSMLLPADGFDADAIGSFFPTTSTSSPRRRPASDG